MTSLYYTACVQEEGQTERTNTHRALSPDLWKTFMNNFSKSIKSQMYQYFTRSTGLSLRRLPRASAASIHPSTLI